MWGCTRYSSLVNVLPAEDNLLCGEAVSSAGRKHGIVSAGHILATQNKSHLRNIYCVRYSLDIFDSLSCH